MCDPCFGLSRTATKRLIAVVFIALSYACAVLIPNVEFVLGLNGGTSSIIISYIMPGLIYLKATSTAHETTVLKVKDVDRSKQWKARGLVVLGVILGFLCTSATLKAVHQEKQVVNLVQDIVDTHKDMQDAATTGQKTLQVVKAVDVVETASKEIGDVKGDTEETLEELHKTAENLNATLDGTNKTEAGSSFWQLPGVADSQNKKKKTEAYRAMLTTIEITIEKVNATLMSVEALQEKLKAVAEEIKNERLSSEGTEDADAGTTTETQMDTLIKELSSALGISVEDETGSVDRTLDAVQGIRHRDRCPARHADHLESSQARRGEGSEGRQRRQQLEGAGGVSDGASHPRNPTLCLGIGSHGERLVRCSRQSKVRTDSSSQRSCQRLRE